MKQLNLTSIGEDSGGYPLRCIIEAEHELMQSEFPNVIEINHILKNQIYGIIIKSRRDRVYRGINSSDDLNIF